LLLQLEIGIEAPVVEGLLERQREAAGGLNEHDLV
jgi:hypothetical protein